MTSFFCYNDIGSDNMSILRYVDIFLLVCLLVIGIETMITFKKNKDNMNNKVKESLIMRFNIITGLTIVITIVNFIIIFID